LETQRKLPPMEPKTDVLQGVIVARFLTVKAESLS
jgi:hypothetical protein